MKELKSECGELDEEFTLENCVDYLQGDIRFYTELEFPEL